MPPEYQDSTKQLVFSARGTRITALVVILLVAVEFLRPGGWHAVFIMTPAPSPHIRFLDYYHPLPHAAIGRKTKKKPTTLIIHELVLLCTDKQ